MKNQDIYATLGNINLPLLKRQKLALLRAIRRTQDARVMDDAELLDGVLNLLDSIHDVLDPPKPTPNQKILRDIQSKQTNALNKLTRKVVRS